MAKAERFSARALRNVWLGAQVDITTDPQDELFEVLDDRGRPTGETKPRGAVHRDGDWHGALHIWVAGVGLDGAPFVLLQRRSLTKDTFPGALDVAVGGHFRAGERLVECLRESEEEIGLAVTAEQLMYLGRRYTCALGGLDREVQDVYAVRSDLPLGAYRLHAEEVAAVARVPVDAALRLFRGQVGSVTGVELSRGSVTETPTTLTVAGFAGLERERYAALALEALLELIEGRRVEPFELRECEALSS